MKKLFLSLMIMLLSVALFAQPQLSYRFANPQLTNGDLTLEFDVEIKADVPGYFLGEHTLSFVYDTDGFGAGIYPDNIYFSKGTLMTGEFFGSQMYDSLGFANTFPNTFSVSVIPLLTSFPPGVTFQNEIPTDWIDLMHFELTIADPPPGGVAGIAFAEFLMNGQQYYYGPATGEVTACVNPNLFEAAVPAGTDMMTYPLPGGGPTAITWNGSVNANWFIGANWDGGSFPGNTDDVLIPSGTPNDPIIEDYANVKGVINNDTITIDPAALGFNAAALIMNNGGQLENNGTIIMKSVYDPGFPPILPSGTFLAQVVPDPIGGLAGTGTYEVQRYMNYTTGTPNPDWEGWHYLSSPVNGFTTESIYNYFLNTWDESATGVDPDFPWIHVEGEVPCTPVTPPVAIGKMEGWSVKEDLEWSSYGCPGGTEDVIEMIGPAWTAPFETSVTRTIYDPATSYEGYNLVGNPFLCGLDLLAVDWTVANANIDPTAYVYQEAIQNYITVSGTTPDPFTGNTIPSTLGFMVLANATGNFTLNGSEQALALGAINKTTTDNTLILKARSSSSYDIMRIRFMEEATTGYDRLWDAHKLFSTAEGVPQIYTPGGEDMLATNAREATAMVPMYFKSAASGSFTIEAIETSDFANVVLEDRITGEQTDLLTGSYTFNYTANDNQERFFIHFTPLGTPELSANSIQIWSNDHKIFVQAPEINGDIVVVNMMGQEVIRAEIEPGLNILPVNDRNSYYVVKVVSDDIARTGKVYVK